ncbi:hypothetical protein CBM2588_A80071 [Cupriavidus taiwanensis]|nr:hypothetical protein CBM2588_A80071 [Cupriavidus taiwanensis]
MGKRDADCSADAAYPMRGQLARRANKQQPLFKHAIRS